ncbi:MAG: hypothetical protein M0008_10430 [Actinomycetota bacterium]|jgi:hypothetical protein|nr:hypothetical protein [Actinomycetota bacterium]
MHEAAGNLGARIQLQAQSSASSELPGVRTRDVGDVFMNVEAAEAFDECVHDCFYRTPRFDVDRTRAACRGLV